MSETIERAKAAVFKVEHLMQPLRKPEFSETETRDRLLQLAIVSDQLRYLSKTSRDNAEALRDGSQVLRRCLARRTSIPH
jgi:hypothetical protein